MDVRGVMLQAYRTWLLAHSAVGTNITSISELIQPFPRSVYAEIDENCRNEVPMDVRGVMLQCLRTCL